MLERIVQQQVIFYVMGILVVLGCFAKLISYSTTRRLVKAASEVQKSNHRLMKLIKAKFEHASMISDKVQNVGAFVDKYIYEYKVFGVRLGAWNAFTKKVIWFIGILGVFSIFESYRMEGAGELMLGYLQWTGIFVMLLVLLGFVTEEKTRLSAAKNYVVEYLENVCIQRYAKMNQAVEEREETVEELPEQDEEKVELPQEEEKKNEQEVRIRAILEEFLA